MWSSKVRPLKLAWMPEDIALCIYTCGKGTAAHTKSHLSVGELCWFCRETKVVTNAGFSVWFATWCCYGPSTPARYIYVSSFLSHGRLWFSLTSLLTEFARQETVSHVVSGCFGFQVQEELEKFLHHPSNMVVKGLLSDGFIFECLLHKT